MFNYGVLRHAGGTCTTCGEIECKSWCQGVRNSLKNTQITVLKQPPKPKPKPKIKAEYSGSVKEVLKSVAVTKRKRNTCKCGRALSKYNTSGLCLMCD